MSHESLPNARFWVYVNGSPVKITLEPDQSLSHREGGATDEGYHYTSTTWEHTGEGVARTWKENARDCDGRLDCYGEDFCPFDSLFAVEPYGDLMDGVQWPAWQPMRRSQRDHAAEAMGY